MTETIGMVEFGHGNLDIYNEQLFLFTVFHLSSYIQRRVFHSLPSLQALSNC